MGVKAGYRQTEVGDIPEQWAVKALGEIANLYQPTTISANLFTEDGYPVYGANGVVGQFHSFNHDSWQVTVTCRGSTCGTVNRTVEKCWITGNAMVVNADQSRDVDKAFLYFLLLGTDLTRCITGTGQPQIVRAPLSAIRLAIPPPPEQRAIAEALSDVDALLSGLDRLIAKKRDLKQAAIQQLLTGQTRLPGFHGEWEVKRLGDVATFFKGRGLPKSAIGEFGSEPCIHYGELFTRYPETIGPIFSRTDQTADTFRSITNDVLMPTSDVTPRGLAKASCIKIDGVILGGDILVIRADGKIVDGSFLSRVIRYEEHQILQLVTGSTVYHLYGSDMTKFTFSMPDRAEQTAIAQVLGDMDAELAVLEARREKTRQLKQGMMQELLTGRTRLV